MNFQKRYFYTSKLPALKRIGPHNQEVISTLVGNLLGDCWGEQRNGATRFHLNIGSPNVEYIFWLHKFYSERGYCSLNKPKKLKQIGIGKNNKTSYSYKWRTFTFSSLNWLYDEFYVMDNNKLRKRIPPSIDQLLDARALAFWIMNDGSANNAGVRISTQCYTHQDLVRLQQVILKNFQLKTTLHKSKEKWVIYFPKSQCPKLSRLIKDLLVHSMHYKMKKFI